MAEEEKKKESKKIKIVIDGEELEAEYKEFQSGNVGFGLYGVVKINDYPYRMSINLIRM